MATKQFRTDIQALRGLAIVLVLLHHAPVASLPGGFLGVDMFFVVSGFLMTGLIADAIAGERFSFRAFYARRVRRLFPAAYATLAVTALVAPLLVDSFEYQRFVAQLAGSFGFVANVVLWRQSDYFSSGAHFKPLLHMWSLAVEEQFYLVLPFVMLVVPRRFWWRLAIVLVAGSAASCVFWLGRSPSATFYLLPTRAWELGIGCLVALYVRQHPRVTAPASVRVICAFILLLTPLIATEQNHPGGMAAVICLATAVLMVPPSASMTPIGLRPLAQIGDRSYSLYLVHWPVIAFANHVFVGPTPAYVYAVLLGVCAVWTELQFRVVEQRFRTLSLTPRVVGVFVLIPLTLTTLSVVVGRARLTADTVAREPNHGLSKDCDFDDRFLARPACRTAPAAATLIWGDSYAMHLVPGLAATSPRGVVQATHTVCGPFEGIAPLNDSLFPRRWAERCIHFNDSVLEYLAAHQEIETVVLSSALAQYVPGAEENHWRLLSRDGGTFRETDQSSQVLLDSLVRTADALHRIGKRTVLFAPPPSLDFDIGRCLDRTGAGLPTITEYPACSLPLQRYHEYRAGILSFLGDVRDRRVIPVLSLDGLLCKDGSCETRRSDTILYADSGHLSRPGSLLLGREMDWGRSIAELPRPDAASSPAAVAARRVQPDAKKTVEAGKIGRPDAG
jgi:peptidoglycan/LPS O-acetylase OafA/YrhL